MKKGGGFALDLDIFFFDLSALSSPRSSRKHSAISLRNGKLISVSIRAFFLSLLIRSLWRKELTGARAFLFARALSVCCSRSLVLLLSLSLLPPPPTLPSPSVRRQRDNNKKQPFFFHFCFQKGQNYFLSVFGKEFNDTKARCTKKKLLMKFVHPLSLSLSSQSLSLSLSFD